MSLNIPHIDEEKQTRVRWSPDEWRKLAEYIWQKHGKIPEKRRPVVLEAMSKVLEPHRQRNPNGIHPADIDKKILPILLRLQDAQSPKPIKPPPIALKPDSPSPQSLSNNLLQELRDIRRVLERLMRAQDTLAEQYKTVLTYLKAKESPLPPESRPEIPPLPEPAQIPPAIRVANPRPVIAIAGIEKGDQRRQIFDRTAGLINVQVKFIDGGRSDPHHLGNFKWLIATNCCNYHWRKAAEATYPGQYIYVSGHGVSSIADKVKALADKEPRCILNGRA